MQKGSERVEETTRGEQGSGKEITFDEYYQDVIETCFRYLNINDISKIGSLCPKEYRILMKSAELKQVDELLHIHEQAFANMTAKATKKSGKHTKSAYRSFKDFFDYEKEIKKVKGEIVEEKINDKFADLAKFISKKAQRKE